MKRTDSHRTDRRPARTALWAVVFVGLLLGPTAGHAVFQSLRVATITATALTVGVRPQFLKIQHTRLNSGSEVTKEVIILGEAGFETPATPPPYNQRLTVLSPAPAPGNEQIEVFVQYRFTPGLSLGQGPDLEILETPKITGPDPMAFAFQIDPEKIGTGLLEYRILGRRLTGSTTTYEMFPREASGEARWITMDVKANALQTIGAQGGRLTLPDGNPADAESYLDVPRGIFVLPTAVTLDEIPLNDPGIPQGLPDTLKMYRLDSQTGFTGNVLLTTLYPDFEYPQGQDGLIDGTQINESAIGIAFWDGFVWRYLGGIVNANSNTITTRIGGTGYFAVVPARALAAQDQRPMEKIITPNGDGRNDVALFTFSNPLDNIQVEIFDMSGHRIRSLYSSTDNGWNGKDDSGQAVETGVYIYQYKSDGKLISGLIAVAK